MHKNLLSTLFLCCCLLFISACSDDNKVIRLTMAHTLDTRHVTHQAMEYMAERLAYYSDNQMEIVIYPAAQLGTERELIELLQIGSLSMTKVSSSPLEGFVPQMKVFGVPYLFHDSEHFWKVLNSQLGQKLLDDLAVARLKGLGYYDAGSRSFYTTDAAIRTPDDLIGSKIRVVTSPMAIATVQSLGGAATPIAWGELYSALQQGVVDGAENNPPSYYLSRHYEIAKYYTLDEHTFVPDIVVASQKVWQQLTTQQQHWLKLAMQDSVTYQRSLWQSASDQALQAVVDAGVEVIYPDKQVFQEKVAPFHASFKGTPIAAQIAAIKAMQEAL